MPLTATEEAQVLASCLGIYAYVTCQSLYRQDHLLPQGAIFLSTATLCPPPTFRASAMWGFPQELKHLPTCLGCELGLVRTSDICFCRTGQGKG